jgi:hypothetical protein
MRKVSILIAGLVCGLALGVAAFAVVMLRRPDYAPNGTPPTLGQDTRRLQTELPLAASKKPYLVLDLLSSRIIYRISGLTPKTIPVKIDSIREGRRFRSLAPDALILLVLQARGAPREVIKPPDPGKPQDPLKDPNVFPPDPPSTYTLEFDRPVKIQILGDEHEGWRGRLSFLLRTVRQWLGKGPGRDEVEIRLSLPAPKAQEIYRGLYRGERILVLGVDGPPDGESPSVTEG